MFSSAELQSDSTRELEYFSAIDETGKAWVLKKDSSKNCKR
jgi:hypothetical protein